MLTSLGAWLFAMLRVIQSSDNALVRETEFSVSFADWNLLLTAHREFWGESKQPTMFTN